MKIKKEGDVIYDSRGGGWSEREWVDKNDFSLNDRMLRTHTHSLEYAMCMFTL